MGNLNLFDVIERAAETSPTLGAEPPKLEPEPVGADLDDGEMAETYGEAGPAVPEDPDPYFDEGIPEEICACMMVDDWEKQEDDDEPEEPPSAERKPANDSGIKVVRNETNVYFDDGKHTYHPNWPEIRAQLGVSESPKEVREFFDNTVPKLTDAELIALVEG